MDPYDDLIAVAGTGHFAAGTKLPQYSVDQAAERLASDSTQDKYADLIAAITPEPDLTQTPDLPPDTAGAGLPAIYQTSIPAVPTDDLGQRIAEGERLIEEAKRLSPNRPDLTPDQDRALHGAMQARQALGLLTQPLNENWQQESAGAPIEPSLRSRMIAELQSKPVPTSLFDTIKQQIAGLPQ